jgi:Asp-tRNA(Asn)/Glu-tRNA(Gln) amidotransferase A subunit family amidase
LTDERLPGGLQIVTPWNADAIALSIGAALEQRLPKLDYSNASGIAGS